MKVRHNTPELFIAGDTPWALGIILLIFTMAFISAGLFAVFQGEWLGLFFVFGGGGMGVGAMAFVVERLQIILDAQTMTATIRSRTMVRYRQTVLPLNDVNHAIVETTRSNSSNRGKLMSRPSLVLSEGSNTTILPITEIYNGGQGAPAVVPAINTWLETLRGSTVDIDSVSSRR